MREWRSNARVLPLRRERDVLKPLAQPHDDDRRGPHGRGFAVARGFRPALEAKRRSGVLAVATGHARDGLDVADGLGRRDQQRENATLQSAHCEEVSVPNASPGLRRDEEDAAAVGSEWADSLR